MLDDDLLIDLGPDLMAAAQMHGISLARLSVCLQTHEHDDHLDPTHLWSRSSHCGVVGAPCLQLFASQGALDKAAAFFGTKLPGRDLLDPATGEDLNLRAHAVEPFQTFDAGRYRVTAVRAAHDPTLTCLLYVVERAGRCLFYCTDTGELPEETWQALVRGGYRFDVVAMDHTFGSKGRSTGHMNAEQFCAQIDRMRALGLLTPRARVFAHHLAHHSNPPHPQLAELAAARGYEVAYDGLVVEV